MACRLSLLLGVLFILPADLGAQTTLLFLHSQPGDFVGGGVERTLNEADGRFVASRNFDNGVTLRFNTPSFSHFWNLDFAAADEAPLTPGIHKGAVRFPLQGPGQPGLSVSGEGRGCNVLTGRFEVIEVTYSPGGEVLDFAA